MYQYILIVKNIFMLESQHLKDVDMTYWEHLQFSLSLSKIFLEASFKAIVHAFLPDVYITSSTDNIKLLQNKMKMRSKL